MSPTTATASNPTTAAAAAAAAAANNNPAPPTSEPRPNDAPSYISDISPPAYSEAAPPYGIPASSSASSPTPTAAATDSIRAPATSSDSNDNAAHNDDDDDDEDLPATPIPFHFIIQQQPPSSSSSSAAEPSSSSTTTTAQQPQQAQPSPPPPPPPKKITHLHPVPTLLLGPAGPPPTPDAEALFVDVLQSALGTYQDECRDAAGPACDVCGGAKESVLLTPISFLHVDEERDGAPPPPAYGGEGGGGGGEEDGSAQAERRRKRVDVLVTPVCGRAECGDVARARLRRAMEGDMLDGGGGADGETVVPRPQGPEDPRCRVCGKVEGTKRCAGCGVVRYCGRECQRADWRRGHRRVCETWAALVEEGRVEEARLRAEAAIGEARA
ncbi:hypothetical protein B0J12DRAFT_72628 [Macrophomina phaseolina]|uniref:MYND-type domain-containing protein n=1 Tax=Macrophomina phaseolina TaxID=35725 RepID=A0ABQ8GDI2_9PEZI|nr:hypothetical protein B0J12DRAFT_72628 [Macrophomina phaseolina]